MQLKTIKHKKDTPNVEKTDFIAHPDGRTGSTPDLVHGHISDDCLGMAGLLLLDAADRNHLVACRVHLV